MINVVEKTINNQIGYEVIDKNVANTKLISYTVHTVKYKDDYDYFIIYNNEMEIVPDIFEFLNFHLSDKTYNTRYKAAQALKLLLSYENIFDKHLKDFKQKDINNFKVFLHGYSFPGNEISLEFSTRRSNSTINSYFSIYRQLMEFMRIEKSIIFKRNGSFNYYDTARDMSYTSERYFTNEKYATVTEIPMYISVKDFKEIIKIIREEYTIREEIIVRLMFQCGLRIGEVFGMTFEDIDILEEDGIFICIGYIRNRCSDKPFQKAKGCIEVYDKKQYEQREYLSKGIGYQMFVLPIDLYDLIDSYIEKYHGEVQCRHVNYYREYNSADSVTSTSQEENFYIFINSLGKPLSQQLWNRTLRDIFDKAGIAVDTKERNHNLNHRFRHGFAMFNVQYLKSNEIELMNLLRQKSVGSVSAYYNPTIKDQIKIKEEFITSLYEVFPDLEHEEGEYG